MPLLFNGNLQLGFFRREDQLAVVTQLVVNIDCVDIFIGSHGAVHMVGSSVGGVLRFLFVVRMVSRSFIIVGHIHIEGVHRAGNQRSAGTGLTVFIGVGVICQCAAGLSQSQNLLPGGLSQTYLVNQTCRQCFVIVLLSKDFRCVCRQRLIQHVDTYHLVTIGVLGDFYLNALQVNLSIRDIRIYVFIIVDISCFVS